ncbi:MAG: prepilin-type N-terminal cleavage/methylation domain-containing protein [Candidatus Woykebacteria bacterium]
MIEKLKSRLSTSKGFTLVELLIVIAIIAILVLIVIIAINPIQRIQDATDRTAESNVRAVATAVEGCLTNRDNSVEFRNCDDEAALISSATPGGPWIRQWPDANTEVEVSPDVDGPIEVCQQAGGNNRMAKWATDTGTVTIQAGTVSANTCP